MKSESIQDIYQRSPQANPLSLPPNNAGLGHFNVFSRDNCALVTPYRRRDFYKVTLIIGTGRLHYASKWIDIDAPALLFSNPVVPYSWEAISQKQSGWFCLFTEQFLQNMDKHSSLQESPLFKIGGTPVFFVNKKQQKTVSEIFVKMTQEIVSDYPYKYDVLRSYLHLLIHEAMKIRPADSYERYHNAAQRVTSLFLELLERQFPIDSPDAHLRLRSAVDYAQSLSIHVNSLNRSVKEVTGKTTSMHIAERILKESAALLRHSDWNISEIAYSLGFEYPAHFTNFYKKKTGQSPAALRKNPV